MRGTFEVDLNGTSDETGVSDLVTEHGSSVSWSDSLLRCMFRQ